MYANLKHRNTSKYKYRKTILVVVLASLILQPYTTGWAAPTCILTGDIPEIQYFDADDPNHEGDTFRPEHERVNQCHKPIESQHGFLKFGVKRSSDAGSLITNIEIHHVGQDNYGSDVSERLIYSWPQNIDGTETEVPYFIDSLIKDPGPITPQNRVGFYKITVKNACGNSAEAKVVYTHWLQPKLGISGPLKEDRFSNEWSYLASVDYTTENVDQLTLVWGAIVFPRDRFPDRIRDDLDSMSAPIMPYGDIPYGEKTLELNPMYLLGSSEFFILDGPNYIRGELVGEGGERRSNMLSREIYRVNLYASFSIPHGPTTTTCKLHRAKKQVMIDRFDDCHLSESSQRNCTWDGTERIFRLPYAED